MVARFRGEELIWVKRDSHSLPALAKVSVRGT